MTFITILTPSLNTGKFIAEAMESARRQNYRDVEQIVLDAGSTDRTHEILTGFPDLQVVIEPDLGAHDAMNKGLRMARGDIIGFLNADDYYAKGVFHDVARLFNADPELEIVVGGSVVFEESSRGSRRIVVARDHMDCGGLSLRSLVFGAPGFNARFFRRRVFDRIGKFDLAYYISADRLFLLRAALSEMKSAVIDRPVYYYRQHSDSRTLNAERRRSREIAHEHRNMAAELLASNEISLAQRRVICDWHAVETVKLIIRDFGSFGSNAARHVSRAFRYDTVWPLRVIEGMSLIRHVRNSERDRSKGLTFT